MARTGNRNAPPQDDAARAARHWNAGKYIRLSKEDLGKTGGDDSGSVAHQRRLLDEFCAEHADEFIGAAEYVDDGRTGTDMSRDGFQCLLADVVNMKINCVIVKDLSRLSRNYSDAGSLIENLFVQLNVRFISLTEGIDSYKSPDSVSSLLVPITNVINDNFCCQTSKKIRQVFDMKRRSGEFIGGFAPYGYMKDPSDRHALIIDEEAAEVVRSVYRWFLDGMSKNAIVRRLNGRGILCPSEYKKSRGLSYKNPRSENNPLWSAKTVNDILKNRVYTGDMVQGRQRVKSYKIHTQEQVPESEWFIVENTHDGIIDRTDFNRVRELLRRDTRTAPQQSALYLFSGFLRCADCGRAMARVLSRATPYYCCRTYKERSKTACTRHSIRHDSLEAAVLAAVRQQIYLTARYDEVIAQLDASAPRQSRSARLDVLIEAKERELARILRYVQSVYEDWKDGEITHDGYLHMSGDYARRINSAREILANLAAERAELKNCATDDDPHLTAYRQLQNIDRLTRPVLTALVDHIRVYENGSISVKFTFADELRRTAERVDKFS